MELVDFDGNLKAAEIRVVPSSRAGKPPYNVTVRAGKAIDCNCMGHRMGHVCRHMKDVQVELDSQQGI